MIARIEMAGRVFGKWTVVSYAGRGRWTCRCQCGVSREVDGGCLRYGGSKACTSCHTGVGHRQTHGRSKTRLYNIWSQMKGRCYNVNDPSYHRYGGRGITICDSWRNDFPSFQGWAEANGYQPDLTIDRKDNNGPYDPDNCRWATPLEQARNTRSIRPVLYQGRTVVIGELAEISGLSISVLKRRIKQQGWSVEQAISTPAGVCLKASS